MNTQIMWTCLPNGVVTTSPGVVASPLMFKMSVVVTPQLTPASSDTPTINGTVFQNWPTYVEAVTSANKWIIAFDNPETTATATMTNNIVASPAFNVDGGALWSAIFPSGTPISTTPTTTASFKIHSYDAGQIATAIRSAHQYAVESHLQYGKLVLTGSDPYSVLLDERKKAKRVLPKMAAALRGVSSGSTHHALRQAYQSETGDVGIGYELMRHALYYDHDKHRANLRAANGRKPNDTSANPALANDFNTILAHLGGQPQLLRKLGLIIDLVFAPPPAVVARLSSGISNWIVYMDTPAPTTYASTYANAVPPVALASTVNVSPKTNVDVASNIFRTTVLGAPTTSTGGTMNNGYVPLGDSTQYTVYTEDTEGSPIKLDIVSKPTATGTDLAAPFPALRTSGIAISQIGRDTSLESAFAKQTTLSQQYWASTGATGNATIYAEDTVRGYAVEIRAVDANGNLVTNPANDGFQSICLRDTRMFFPGLAGTNNSFVISDEGYTKASVANAQGDGELDLHSALFGWEGWSLGAQRPGRAITAATPPGDIVQTETPVQPVNVQASNYPNSQFTVRARAGSLPKLRFGYSYTLRARILDLAGNDMSLPAKQVGLVPTTLNGNTKPHWSAQISYLRYEPVPNPVLNLQAPLTEGEHLENLVIRSNPWGPVAGQGAAAYAAAANQTTGLPAGVAPLNPMNAYSATSARWVAPPKGAWAQAEAMGAFDANYFSQISAAVDADITSGALVAGQAYNNATFLAKKNALFACSQKEAGLFTDAQIWNTATGALVPNPSQIVTPPNAQNLPAPTNPGQPLAPGQYNIIPVSASTPAIIPYLPDFNAHGIALQQLVNGVPTGSATRTFAPRVGCLWPEIDMPQFVLADGGLSGTMPVISGPGSSTSNPSNVDPVSTTAAPAPNAPIVFSLPPGGQFSFSYGSVVGSTAVMASNDLNAASTTNAIGANGLATIPTYAPYRTINLVHAVQQPKPPSALTHAVSLRNPGDTNVVITGGFTADGLTSQSVDFTASWAEFVDVELGANIIQATDNTNRRITLKQARLQTWTLGTTDGPISFTPNNAPAQPNAVQPLQLQFGDTKTRLVNFQATATSRFREYFPASLQSNAKNFQNAMPAGTFSETTLLSSGTRVPSTARPIAPKVLYVVPTFQWATSKSGSTTTNVRTGRGLRVFVDRPWFTSGDTEQLAVLVNPEGTAPTALAGFVSQWGMDPTRNSQYDSLLPLDQNQIQGGVLTPAVPLAEFPAESVTILAFNPSAYDTTRQLWYFDIEFAANIVEAPFVRLALARFQANSLGGPAFPNTASGVPSGDLRMSNVVLADMVKLSADRTGTYLVNADSSVTVTVAGHVYANAQWQAGSAAITVPTVNTAAASGRMLFAQVLETTATNPGEFDWYPVGSAINLTPSQLAGAGNNTSLSFTGSVPKPTLGAGATGHQLLITEHEVFLTDVEAAFPGTAVVNNYPPGAMQMHPRPPPPALPVNFQNTTSRIIFSDILPLTY